MRVAGRPFLAILRRTFRGSTTVVQLPVKELVVGSNPTRGARIRKAPFGAFSNSMSSARNRIRTEGRSARRERGDFEPSTARGESLKRTAICTQAMLGQIGSLPAELIFSNRVRAKITSKMKTFST